MSIRLEYLYRDAGNYKNWGEIVFANRNGHDVASLEEQARSVLIDGDFFVASKASVPDLHFDEHIGHLDHDWHQFDSLTATDDKITDEKRRDIADFLEALEQASNI